MDHIGVMCALRMCCASHFLSLFLFFFSFVINNKTHSALLMNQHLGYFLSLFQLKLESNIKNKTIILKGKKERKKISTTGEVREKKNKIKIKEVRQIAI